MVFEFRPSFREQYRGTLAVMIRARLQWIGAVAFTLGGLVLFFSSGLVHGLTPTQIAAIAVFMLVGWCVLWFPGMAAMSVLSRRNPGSRGTLAWQLDEDGIGISAPLANWTLRWDALRRVVETRSFFLFYVSRQYAHVLPKRVVGTGPELDALRRLIGARQCRR